MLEILGFLLFLAVFPFIFSVASWVIGIAVAIGVLVYVGAWLITLPWLYILAVLFPAYVVWLSVWTWHPAYAESRAKANAKKEVRLT